MITVLAGGTGSVKLVRGLAAQENDVCVISNVGDNYWVYGMYVCPDIDTMVYGLADLLDSKRSWGIKNDSFNFLRQMEVFGEETWFRMGDRDAATNLMRTNMLKDGKNLGFITDWLCKKFAVGTKIIPMTDNNVETRITTPKGEMHLQEFWVKHRGKEKVQGVIYRNNLCSNGEFLTKPVRENPRLLPSFSIFVRIILAASRSPMRNHVSSPKTSIWRRKYNLYAVCLLVSGGFRRECEDVFLVLDRTSLCYYSWWRTNGYRGTNLIQKINSERKIRI